MSDITPTTPDPLAVPPCPPWCTLAPHDFDSELDDGRLVRDHDGGIWPSLPHGGGYRAVTVGVSVAEYTKGSGTRLHRLTSKRPCPVCS